jgi:hypothetical protein
MTNRRWILVLLGLATSAAILGLPRLGQAGATDRTYVAGRFALQLSGGFAGFLKSADGVHVTAEVVNEVPANSPIGHASCNLEVAFFDAAGLTLHAQELTVGPGQIGAVELPEQNYPIDGRFHITFRVLDRKKNGDVRPCFALTSARVHDKSGKTLYYIPMVTN